MAKYIPETTLDAMLEVIDGPVTTLHVCDNQPTDYSDLTTMELAQGAIGPGTPGGATPGTGGARNNAFDAVADMSITKAGTNNATHVALSNGSNQIYLVTTCTSQALTQGGTVSTSGFTHTLNQPT